MKSNGSKTTKLILTKEEIGECRQRILFSDAEIEVHIINALCDMALMSLKGYKKCPKKQ